MKRQNKVSHVKKISLDKACADLKTPSLRGKIAFLLDHIDEMSINEGDYWETIEEFEFDTCSNDPIAFQYANKLAKMGISRKDSIEIAIKRAEIVRRND
jgi:hypothetical protein